ncbi:MAG TPA: hypothetical protein VLB44_06185 [Kofleriaceae bacterium]|nr:hypothetical protein [Kofleriaceae bacterium]
MRSFVLLALLALLALPGCPICESNTALAIVSGDKELLPGEQVSLALDSEGFSAGPTLCRGHWYVEGIEGGNTDVGTVTSCGIYTAPTTAGSRRAVRVEATKYELDGCADCCPYGQAALTLAAP